MSTPINVPSGSSYHGGSSSGRNRALNRITLSGRSSPSHNKVNLDDDATTLTNSQIREQTLSHTWKELRLGTSFGRAGTYQKSPVITLGDSPAYADHLGIRHRGSLQRNSLDAGRASFDSESRRKSSIDDRLKPPKLDTSFDPPILLRHDETTPGNESDDDSELTNPESAHRVSSATSTHGKAPIHNHNINSSPNDPGNRSKEPFSSALQHLTTSFQRAEQPSGRAPLLPPSSDVSNLSSPRSSSNLSRDIESLLNTTDPFDKYDVRENDGVVADDVEVAIEPHADERTPLLNTENEDEITPQAWFYAQFQKLTSHGPKDIMSVGVTGFKAIPAVVLGLLLNILDAMSYGIIIFPASDSRMSITATNSGISMFLVSSIIAQFVYTLGGSGFKGANGSMMIEVMPFLHIMVRAIETRISSGEDTQKELMATIMVAYAMSTILTGLAFLALGYFKLGNIIQFFPRHILVGCIGGIGLFLVQTAVEVTTNIKPSFTFDYLRSICMPDALKLWGTALCLALGLKLVQKRFDHPLFVPAFYMCVPLIFYAIVAAARIPFDTLRSEGWLFNLPESGNGGYSTFWTYFDFHATRWDCLPDVLPTMLALAFFGLLHVPINIPALAVSTHQDVDINKELMGHGVSNLLSGIAGSTQNYLVYSNSVLFYRSGGGSRIAELLLALATIGIWIGGGRIVGFVPVIVVGSLIFLLGVDLVKESLWDSFWVGIHPLEYLTIVLIVGTMGIFGFTEGIVAGIIFACIFFVVMYARKRVIRADYTGKELRSTVHRLYVHQRFLDKVGVQIRVMKLQGFIFFGSINQLDDYLRKLLRGRTKARFVVLDFALISDIDYSAMEAFLRIKRTLRERNIHLVFCGLGSVGKELANVGVVDRDDGDWVHVFGTLNAALEWCENVLLSSYHKRTERARRELLKRAAAELAASNVPSLATAVQEAFSEEHTRVSSPIPTPIPRVDSLLSSSLAHASPRQIEVYEAVNQVVSSDPHFSTAPEEIHPVEFLIRAFGDVTESARKALSQICEYFEKTAVGPNAVIWHPQYAATELLVVDSGELLVEYVEVDRGAAKIVETCIPGIMIGELEMFAGRPRTSRVRAGDKGAVLWQLKSSVFDQICENDPHTALNFIKLALGFDGNRVYNVISHAFHSMD